MGTTLDLRELEDRLDWAENNEVPMTLAELHDRNRYSTDKLEIGYGSAYEKHLGQFRGRQITLWEIGVRTGGSLRMWSDYLGPSAEVIGFDVERPTEDLPWPIKFVHSDATDPELVRRVLAEVGRPDVVIDDGSHMAADIRASFGLIWPHVRSLYVVEDLGTQYEDFHDGHYLRDAAPFTADLFEMVHSLLRLETTCPRTVCFERGQVFLYK